MTSYNKGSDFSEPFAPPQGLEPLLSLHQRRQHST